MIQYDSESINVNTVHDSLMFSSYCRKSYEKHGKCDELYQKVISKF